MITNGQASVIKEICKIQIASLENVLITPFLEEDNQSMLDLVGIPRSEFDSVILKFRDFFVNLNNNPQIFYEADNESLIMVLFILNRLDDDFKIRFPNAIANLTRKVLMMTSINMNTN